MRVFKLPLFVAKIKDFFSFMKTRQFDLIATTNINIASAPTSIDGQSGHSAMTVLLTAQSTPSQNGGYLSAGAGQPMTRITNYNTDATIRGSTVWAQRGSSNIGKRYQNTNTGTITIGSTSITYAEEIQASTGLFKSGRAMGINATGVSPGAYVYGGAYVAEPTINAQGQITAVAVNLIQINASQVSGLSTGLTRGKIQALAENAGA